MPDMYREDDIDVAGFAVGIIEKSAIINYGLVSEGDVIAGISSSGVHSNGFSLVRKLIEDKNLDLNKKYDWADGISLGDLLLVPTKLYFKIIDRMLKDKIGIHGIAHITGGGFYENISRIIPGDMNAFIQEGSWRVPDVFKLLWELGNIDRDEMFRVFNMGIGMVIIISPRDFDKAKNIASELGEDIYNIGNVIRGNGRVIIKKS